MFGNVKSQIYFGLIFFERDGVRDKSSMIEMVSLSQRVRKRSGGGAAKNMNGN